MKKWIAGWVLILCSCSMYGQTPLLIKTVDATTLAPLSGVSLEIEPSGMKATTDSNGIYRMPLSSARPTAVTASFTGYSTVQVKNSDGDTLIIKMEMEVEELDDVIVTATRTSRSIGLIPTRTEVITGEELDEKANMSPGNITMLLRESTGIQVQQTSAVSGSAAFRLQGLPGRYTQLLKDGFPLYSGYSGGLSLLQIPPLDLRQVEVIKGSASTLYGGGAIAGLINLVSKQPTANPESLVYLNGTTAGGFDGNAFFTRKYGNTGFLLFGTVTAQSAFDPANAGFSAIPKQQRLHLNPKIFHAFGNGKKIMAALNYNQDQRLGGSMNYIKDDNVAEFFEQNKSRRISSQFSYEAVIDSNTALQFKNSVQFFRNRLTQPGYYFGGRQTGSYTELNVTRQHERSVWIAGVNVWTDNFREDSLPDTEKRDFNTLTTGVFLQNTSDLGENVKLETGLRADYNHMTNQVQASISKWFFLPRFSLLYKINQHFSSRIGGGLGYKMPTIFNEEAEAIAYRAVLPLDLGPARAEQSYGVNADVYYKGNIGACAVYFDQFFFFTHANYPLVMSQNAGKYSYVNADGNMTTRGFESQLKLKVYDWAFFGGYTYQWTQRSFAGQSEIPFAPNHRLLMTLMYDKEDDLKFGLESAFNGPQFLTDGRRVRSFWTAGFSAEKIWEHFSIYINFENFTDTRQTKWEPLYTGTRQRPLFAEVYAPIDGFVFNGGIKLKL